MDKTIYAPNKLENVPIHLPCGYRSPGIFKHPPAYWSIPGYRQCGHIRKTRHDSYRLQTPVFQTNQQRRGQIPTHLEAQFERLGECIFGANYRPLFSANLRARTRSESQVAGR